MFKSELKLTNDQIAGLLCNAMDMGAINYWAILEARNKPKRNAKFEGDWLDYPLYSYPLGSGGSLKIRDTQTNKLHTLDLKAIQRGVKLLSTKAPKALADILQENDDTETGDVFMQLCLFGEVVYG